MTPYRPDAMTAVVPCSALRAAGPAAVALATGPEPGGLVVTGRAARVGGTTVDLGP
ncbi:hypothetical protein, partial [Mycobacterium sp. AT1]|uniref:hypothetical protein n=1 Tax=Mycobacterium sp. AT1 TaxID=1961706 RepID=UPI0035165A45